MKMLLQRWTPPDGYTEFHASTASDAPGWTLGAHAPCRVAQGGLSLSTLLAAGDAADLKTDLIGTTRPELPSIGAQQTLLTCR